MAYLTKLIPTCGVFLFVLWCCWPATDSTSFDNGRTLLRIDRSDIQPELRLVVDRDPFAIAQAPPTFNVPEPSQPEIPTVNREDLSKALSHLRLTGTLNDSSHQPIAIINGAVLSTDDDLTLTNPAMTKGEIKEIGSDYVTFRVDGEDFRLTYDGVDTEYETTPPPSSGADVLMNSLLKAIPFGPKPMK